MKSREWRMQGNKTSKLKEKDLDFSSKHAEIFQERKHEKKSWRWHFTGNCWVFRDSMKISSDNRSNVKRKHPL